MLVPSLWKHPPISGLTKFLNPPFAGFSCLGDPPKSRTLLIYPPIFHFITPFLNFSGVQRERERQTTPFLKEISGWKVKYPFFFFFFFTILGPDFVARKVPLYRRFWEHACGPSDPGVGGGGGPGWQQTDRQTYSQHTIIHYLELIRHFIELRLSTSPLQRLIDADLVISYVTFSPVLFVLYSDVIRLWKWFIIIKTNTILIKL